MSQLWEDEIAGLLSELSVVQGDLLKILDAKRQALRTNNLAELDAMSAAEQSILARLQACQDRRTEMLRRAATQGLPHDSIRSLAGTVKGSQQGKLVQAIDDSRHRSRLLQHQSLTNWVLVQRSLVHLSHLLEIIATNGRRAPTYERGDSALSTGALVDEAA